jgi:hypothetical protein
MFTVSGKFRGRTVEVTWDDGQLSGDEEACKWIKWRVDTFFEGTVILAYGTAGDTNHLADPYRALYVITLGLQFPPLPTIIRGGIPPIPGLTKDMIV